ncbi:MAG TPA: alpha/beta hydrolase [Flexivirga sp.]|uniref:alpha/beta fold hydrolase n=1 Tax=Flexivirga sp. TaxID=1962927 RepID=UPI002D1011C7|nr:alpha/beta hydrolase [Flexivirga sp.]HWC22748.1 alpha/beta hydrolase [Flexivirga sp.]
MQFVQSLNDQSVTMPIHHAPVERKTVTGRDVRIEVLTQGDGPVIVICPSLGRGAGDYDVVAGLLAMNGFRVLRPQPRGIGDSIGPLDGLGMHDFAADIALVLDDEHATRRPGRAVVVGHAWGSQPARMLAVDRPDLVSALVLAAASAGRLPPGSTEKPYGRLRWAIDGAGDPTRPEHERLECLRRAFFAPGHDARPWLTGWSVETHAAQTHARNTTPIDAYFAGGTVPILDLQAQFDAVVIPGVFQSLLGARVTVQEIPDAGHALAPEQPVSMATAIANFAGEFATPAATSRTERNLSGSRERSSSWK